MHVLSIFSVWALLLSASLVLNKGNVEESETTEIYENQNNINSNEYRMEESDQIQKEHLAFSQEWNRKMADYESPYVYVIPVAYKSHQIFYENITNVPIKVRGAFILDEHNLDKIHFTIRAPNNTVIYSNTTHHDVFDFIADAEGIYEIAFNNAYKNSELKPTFTMNTEQNVILKKDDLNHTEKAIDQMITFLRGITTEEKMKRNIHQDRYLSKLIKSLIQYRNYEDK